jgi:hypothetical protein
MQPIPDTISRGRFARTSAGAAVLAASLFFGAAPLVHAQDKATLDLLVKKGVITQDEADSVAKDAAVVVTPKDANVKALKLEGLLQAQYDWISVQDKGTAGAPAKTIPNPAATNEFLIRRAYFGAIADLGNGWGGEILLDFAAGPGGPPAAPQGGSVTGVQNNFEKLVIYKKFDDWGTGTAGFQKVPFVYEEQGTPSSELKPIERSIATNYFTGVYGGPVGGRLGFGNRHTGLYWNGLVPGVDGLFYGVAITNGIQSVNSFTNVAGGQSFNRFGYWADLGYGSTYDNVSYKVGVNVGYSSDGNSNQPLLGGTFQSNSIWGYNPYATITWNGLSLTGEFIQAGVANGRATDPGAAEGAITGNTSKADPYGFNFTPSYKLNDQWELVGRFSYLRTNGRGASINQQVTDAPNVVGTDGTLFNQAWSLYGGVNYYIIGNSVKIQAGYEFSQFYDRVHGTATGIFGGPRANVSAIRTRIQVLF